MLDLGGKRADVYAPLVVPHPWLQESSAPRALIFYYHRISAELHDPCGLNVSPDNFARHVEVFSRELNCITFAELVHALENKRLMPRTAVITLDDGYADALHQAGPILRRFGVAATVFVTARSGSSSTSEFWWDRLEQIVLAPGPRHKQLSLQISGEARGWYLDRSQQFSLRELEQHRGWNLHQPPPTERHALFAELHGLLSPLAQELRESVLDQLSLWSGREPICRENRRTLSSSELKQLAQLPNIELGAHTISHPVLAHLDEDEQLREIAGSKSLLEKITGMSVRSFAYPYGCRGDFTPRTVELVRKAGFTGACCTVPDVTWPGSDCYRLPRIPIFNCSADLISDWLKLWF